MELLENLETNQRSENLVSGLVVLSELFPVLSAEVMEQTPISIFSRAVLSITTTVVAKETPNVSMAIPTAGTL